jgi:hypothetical protein
MDKAKQIRLAIDKNTADLVSFCLKRDGDSQVVDTQYMHKRRSKSTYLFNVNELLDGLYTLEISNAQQVVTHQVTVDTAETARSSRQIAIAR